MHDEICFPAVGSVASRQSALQGQPQLQRATLPEGMSLLGKSAFSLWARRGHKDLAISAQYGMTPMDSIYPRTLQGLGQGFAGLAMQADISLCPVLLPPSSFDKCWSLVNILNPKLHFSACFWRPQLVTWGFNFPICIPWKSLARPFADVGGSWISGPSLPYATQEGGKNHEKGFQPQGKNLAGNEAGCLFQGWFTGYLGPSVSVFTNSCRLLHRTPPPPTPPAGDRLNREGLEYVAMKFSAVSYKKVVGQCSRVILACH